MVAIVMGQAVSALPEMPPRAERPQVAAEVEEMQGQVEPHRPSPDRDEVGLREARVALVAPLAKEQAEWVGLA